jgi:hypothetical protein
MKASFQTAFCEHFQCSPGEYADRVFWSCLNAHARPIARFLLRSHSAFFREDMAFIREVGTAVTRGEVICELNRFYGRNLRDKNWLRRTFGIRISGKRVLRLYRMLSRCERAQARGSSYANH